MKLVFLAEHQWSMHYAIEAYDNPKNIGWRNEVGTIVVTSYR